MKARTFIIGLLTINQAFAAETANMQDLLSYSLEQVYQADVLVSSSTKIATKASQAPNIINSYTYKDIEKLSARKLSDLLWTVAGFQVQMVPNGRERVWVRGVQSEFNHKMSLYIDGVPIRNVFGGFDIDEEIPIESIEKIEIIRGPGSALYGANAFSGVINISTFQGGQKLKSTENSTDDCKDCKKADVLRTTKNNLKGIVGEDNTYGGYFSVQQAVADAVDVVIEGKGLTSDGRSPEFNRDGKPNGRNGEYDLNYLHLNLAALDGELQFNTYYNRYYNEREDYPAPRENDRVAKSLRFSLAYKHQFSDVLGIDLNAYHTNTNRIEQENDFFDPITHIPSWSIKLPGEIDLSGFYGAVNYKPIDSNQIVAGFDFKRDVSVKTDFIDKLSNTLTEGNYNDLYLQSYSIFLQDTQNIIDEKTQFTAGIRYDILDLFEDQFSYRLGLTHAFNDNIYAKLLYGTSYRAPSFVEYIYAPNGPADAPDVETMDTLEGQIGYQDKNLQLSLSPYWNRYDDFIARKNSFNSASGILDSSVFGNVDDLEILGAEFETKYSYNKNWSGFLNASISHARSKTEKQKLPLLADWTAATGIDWRDNFSFGELSFNNYWIVYGKRRDWPTDIWDAGVSPHLPNRDSGLTDGFAVWNTALHYKLPLRGQDTLDFDLSVHNLLDKQYFTQSSSPPASDRSAYYDTEYEGRQLRFSINYSWQ